MRFGEFARKKVKAIVGTKFLFDVRNLHLSDEAQPTGCFLATSLFDQGLLDVMACDIGILNTKRCDCWLKY